MNETRALLEAASALRASGEAYLVATVVRVRGSSYRRPGARMLLTRDRWIAGSVSGGCLEAELVKKGFWHTEAGAKVVTYDARGDDDVGWGLGVGCDGVIDVLLERGGERRIDPLAMHARSIDEQRRFAIATVFGGAVRGSTAIGARVVVSSVDGSPVASQVDDALLEARLVEACRDAIDRNATTACAIPTAKGSIDALIEVIRPPPRLFVFGDGHDAVPLVAMARAIGWDAIVCERSPRFATRERFAREGASFLLDADAVTSIDASDRPLAIVMTHDYARDRATLDALLDSRALYVGALGPRRRTERMLAELGRARDPRIHAPVGLDLGAETPHEIALAIVAEAQSVLARATAASLRDVEGPIHARREPSVAAE